MNNISVVSGDGDVLNSSYLTSFKDENGNEFQSVEHYCQYNLLSRLGMITDAEEVLDCHTAAGMFILSL